MMLARAAVSTVTRTPRLTASTSAVVQALSPKYAISIVRRFCALAISARRCLASATRCPFFGLLALNEWSR